MSEPIKVLFRKGFDPLVIEMPKVVFVEKVINEILGSMADEININNGFVEYFHDGGNLELKAISTNTETTKKMTTKLQIVINSIKGLN